MNIETEILRLLSDRFSYDKYVHYIKDYTLTDKATTIIADYGKMFTDDPLLGRIEFSVYKKYFTILHPTMKEDKVKVYLAIIDQVATNQPSIATEKILQHYVTMAGATKAYDQINKLMDGDTSIGLVDIMDTIDDTMVALEDQSTTITAEEKAKQEGVVSTDLAALMTSTVLAKGYEWRLEDLNRSIGSVHLGDFIIVAARTEVGKTTFVTDQTSFMAEQMTDDECILFFNNEEAGASVQSRYYQSALFKSAQDLAKDPIKYQKMYQKIMGRNDKIQVLQPDYLDMRYIERKVKEYKPSIIVLNTLDEVHGIDLSDNGPTKLKKLYVWARELGVKYDCAVFAVCQADASAEGQRYLHVGQLDESKTGKPKTADIIIMIGKDPNMPNERFINIPKNKHPSGPRQDPSMSHGRHEVTIDELRGRYLTKAYR